MSAPAELREGEDGEPLEGELRRLCSVIDARRRYIDALRELMEAIHAPPGDPEILARLERGVDAALVALGAQNGSLLALDEDSGELVFVVARGSVPGDRLRWRHLRPGEGVAAWVARHARPCIVNDTSGDERFFPEVDAETGYHTRSILAVPLIRERRVLGVLELLNKGGERLFTTSDETRAMLLAHLGAELLTIMAARRR